MKFKKISVTILAISLILTVNAAAYNSTPESSLAAKPALQTSYDRSELTNEEERAIIEQWLEEYPDAVVGTSNGMLVLDTRPWSDFSTESAPACMPGFSMEEYQAEYSTPDEENEAIEEQPPELTLHDKMIIELFNGMNEEQRLEAIENDFLKGISVDAYGVVISNMTEKELAALLNKILVLDSTVYNTVLQTSYDRSELTIEEERAIIEQWLEEYPDAVVGTSNGMLVLDTRPWSDFSAESAPACMPDFSIPNSTTETNTLNPRIIVDDDNRRHCLTTSVAPFSFTAYTISLFDKGNNTYVPAGGTAFFVDKDLLLTAGHCVYHPDYGYAEKIYIFPGGCESGISYSVSYTSYASNEWVNSSNSLHDYGVIKVLVDISYGYYALSEKTDSQLKSKDITLYGFPNDKPYSGTKPVSGIGDFYEFWISTGSITSSSNHITDNLFFHSADTQSGNSGSPIFLSDSVGTVVGINTANAEELDSNFALRITSPIIQFVNRYK